MNILISGFGNIGCRHAQSLLNSKHDYNIFVIEPSDESFKSNFEMINASNNDITRVPSINELESDIDLAICATSSKHRYMIMNELIDYGIKYFLVEKVVFQSLAQFDSIIKKLEINSGEAYCHYPRRYYKNFNDLKFVIQQSNCPIKINVFGGNNGLGCNAIHFMDLIEFFTGSNICRSYSCMQKDNNYDRRESFYTDLNGLLVFETYNKDQLSIYFDPTYRAGITIVAEIETEKYIFSTRDKKEYQFKNHNIIKRNFEVLLTSHLTETLVKDILNKNTYLPTIKQSRNAHSFLFKEIIMALGKKFNSNILCPIT